MIAVDANILVYAHREDSPFHDVASQCVADLAQGKQIWALPWPCLHEFLAVVTHPRIYSPPTPMGKAVEQIDAWLELPTVTLLSEMPSYWQTLRHLAVSSRIAGPQVHDARIAALCLQHGVLALWSADRDFSRYSSLKVENPLAPA